MRTVRVLPPIEALPVWWGLSWRQTRKMTSLDRSTLFKHLWAYIQRFLRSLSVFILLLHIIASMQCNSEVFSTMVVCIAAKRRYFFFSNGMLPENTEPFFHFFDTFKFPSHWAVKGNIDEVCLLSLLKGARWAAQPLCIG